MLWCVYICAVNTGWREIHIHSCYSLVKITIAPIAACKNARRIWRHNAISSRSRNVTNQLWWRHNAKSEKTVFSDIGKMSDWWLFLADFLCSGHKMWHVANKIMYVLSWILILCQERGNSARIFMSETHCRIASIVTKISTHGNSYIIYIILYIFTML